MDADSPKPKKPKRPSPLVPEPLSSAGPARPDCITCGLWKRAKRPFMRPFVPRGWAKRLLVVGEAPGGDEDERSGRPFTGPAGKLLTKLLGEAGFGDADVALANAVRCRPPANRTPTMRQIRCCRPFLETVLRGSAPAAVLGMGATALRALTNDGSRQSVTAERGRDIEVPGGPRCRITYHPAACLYPGGGALRAEILKDLSRLAAPAAPIPHPEDAAPAPGKVIALDTEWSRDARLVVVGLADKSKAKAWSLTNGD